MAQAADTIRALRAKVSDQAEQIEVLVAEVAESRERGGPARSTPVTLGSTAKLQRELTEVCASVSPLWLCAHAVLCGARVGRLCVFCVGVAA